MKNLKNEFYKKFVISDTLHGKSVKRIMAADTKNVFKWFKSKLKKQDDKLFKTLKELYFCSARIRSATFRAIDRKQFDDAVEAAEKVLNE